MYNISGSSPPCSGPLRIYSLLYVLLLNEMAYCDLHFLQDVVVNQSEDIQTILGSSLPCCCGPLRSTFVTRCCL